MSMFRSSYSPEGTQTFKFFGEPQVRERPTPVTLFFHDCWNVVIHTRLMTLVLSTIYTIRPVDELYIWASPVLSLVWFGIWSLIGAGPLLILLGIFLTLLTVFIGILKFVDFFIWKAIQGPQLQVWPPELPDGHNKSHRWVYINGVATGKTITRQNLQCLSQTFHNPVLAVNNRTFGFVGDLLECLVQRAFGYRTKETGIMYNIINDFLRDSAVERVVFIAHSQGGIIASQILDDLYCDLSSDELAKLEIYTFGSAALTFRNPWTDSSHTARVVPTIEHYCNERDMVTSWGALSSLRKNLPFDGKVFVFEGQTGHMLNQHYLAHMFGGGLPAEWADDNFLLRLVVRDQLVSNKYYVKGRKAGAGDVSVQDVSKLWTYLRKVEEKVEKDEKKREKSVDGVKINGFA